MGKRGVKGAGPALVVERIRRNGEVDETEHRIDVDREPGVEVDTHADCSALPRTLSGWAGCMSPPDIFRDNIA